MSAQTIAQHSIYKDFTESKIQIFFWSFGLVFAAIDAYSSRFFINNDAIVYIEIGEAIKEFNWYNVVNFTFSPVYGLLFAIFQSLFRLSPFDEILWAKILNYIVFVGTLFSFELFLRFVKREYLVLVNSGKNPLPWTWILVLLYSIFLVTTLVSVRVRLINPDMLVYCLVLICSSVIMSIRENPTPYYKYVLLGFLAGIGYLTKAFLFLFSPVFLIMAAFSVGSFKRSVPRIAIALLLLILTIGPLLVALSMKKGSFTYGEGGRHVYSILIGGQGEPVNPGKVLNEKPRVVVYEYGNVCTRPFTFDVCYWTIGINPKFDHITHSKLFLQNLIEVITQSPWLLAILAFVIFQISIGSYHLGSLRRISFPILFISAAICGISIFALISMEPRYVAPFLFLGSVGLILGLDQGNNQKVFRKLGTSDLGVLTLVFFLLGSVVQSSADQAMRGLSRQNGKISYRQAYEDQVLVSDFLSNRGIVSGDKVAVIGSPPIQWARMAGIRVTGEIEDPGNFLTATKTEENSYLNLLKNEGIKAVIAEGKQWSKLSGEDWFLVPGTETYYARFLAP